MFPLPEMMGIRWNNFLKDLSSQKPADIMLETRDLQLSV